MPAFNPATAYEHDYQFRDRVEDAVLVVRDANGAELSSYPVKLVRGKRVQSDHQPHGSSLFYGAHETPWELWRVPPDDDVADPPAPSVDNALLLDDADDQGNRTELVITQVAEQINGPKWDIAATEPPRNE